MFNAKDDKFLYALGVVVQKRKERIDGHTYANNMIVESNAIDSTWLVDKHIHSNDIQRASSPGSLDGRKAHITSTRYMQDKLTRADLHNSTIVSVVVRLIPNRISYPRTGASATFRRWRRRWEGLKIQVRIGDRSHLGK